MKTWEVWVMAGHDMCGCSFGGILFGTAEAESWEEACKKVMEPRNDIYWEPGRPYHYWGVPLCKSEEEAFCEFNPKHPAHPSNRILDTV